MRTVVVEDLRPEQAAFNVDDSDFDLFRAACLMGRIEEPDLNVESVSRQVAEIAASVRMRSEGAGAWPEPLAMLVEEMFIERGFKGDSDAYDAPRNSFMHDVLRTKRGLPISLSLLFIEVARRAGIDAFGIPFPGHFLVGVRAPTEADGPIPSVLVVDPFHGGKLRSADDLERHLKRVSGRRESLTAEHLSPAEPSLILQRLLYNLRSSYIVRGDPSHLVRVLSRLLILRPADGALYLERARTRRVLLDDEGARQDADLARRISDSEEDAEAFLGVLDDETRHVH